MNPVIEWLLEENQPSIRYLTLTELLDKSNDDPEISSTRRQISETGWAANILSKENPAGWWVNPEDLYRPKYQSTNWMLLTLSDLGLTRADPRIDTACELWIKF